MASAIFAHKLSQWGEGDHWRVESAGTWAVEGMPAAQNTQLTLAALYQTDIQEHRSRVVTHELLSSFDLILTMEKGHKEALQIEFPDLAGRVYLISEMIGDDKEIDDPIGGPLLDYRQTARELDGILTGGYQRIRQLAERRSGQSA
jgi:protein-tyrosine phosphatase